MSGLFVDSHWMRESSRLAPAKQNQLHRLTN